MVGLSGRLEEGSKGNSAGGARCWAGCFKLHISCMRSALFLPPLNIIQF